MEILRVPPYSDIIDIAYTIPAGIVIDDILDYVVVDMADLSSLTGNISGPAGSVVPISVSGEYDTTYHLKVFKEDVKISEDFYTIVRPYVNPNDLGTTASEISDYAALDEIVRAIIDTHTPDGFYNKKKTIQAVGQGGDYFSLWKPVNKVLKVYENNVLVYDVDTPEDNLLEYSVTPDGTAIQRTEADLFNRAEQGVQKYPASYGDLGYIGSSRSVDFPRGYDYTFVVDSGYKMLPSDVVRAAKMLLEDVKCGKLDYYSKYVTSYNTDQFKVQFDKRMLEGTGNALVDKILEKYSNTITRPGLL